MNTLSEYPFNVSGELEVLLLDGLKPIGVVALLSNIQILK
jgi:hypothetical protein